MRRVGPESDLVDLPHVGAHPAAASGTAEKIFVASSIQLSRGKSLQAVKTKDLAWPC